MHAASDFASTESNLKFYVNSLLATFSGIQLEAFQICRNYIALYAFLIEFYEIILRMIVTGFLYASYNVTQGPKTRNLWFFGFFIESYSTLHLLENTFSE